MEVIITINIGYTKPTRWFSGDIITSGTATSKHVCVTGLYHRYGRHVQIQVGTASSLILLKRSVPTLDRAELAVWICGNGGGRSRELGRMPQRRTSLTCWQQHLFNPTDGTLAVKDYLMQVPALADLDFPSQEGWGTDSVGRVIGVRWPG